jgi:prevent-host-death family protein
MEAKLNVAEAKKQFSELLGRVAFGGESFLITRRGRPMARLVPVQDDKVSTSLADVKGWLADDDPFFEIIDDITSQREAHVPRVLRNSSETE